MVEGNESGFSDFLEKKYPSQYKDISVVGWHRNCTFIIKGEQHCGILYLIKFKIYGAHLIAFSENVLGERVNCNRIEKIHRRQSDKSLQIFFKDKSKKPYEVIANDDSFSIRFLTQISQYVPIVPVVITVKQAQAVWETGERADLSSSIPQSKSRSSSLSAKYPASFLPPPLTIPTNYAEKALISSESCQPELSIIPPPIKPRSSSIAQNNEYSSRPGFYGGNHVSEKTVTTTEKREPQTFKSWFSPSIEKVKEYFKPSSTKNEEKPSSHKSEGSYEKENKTEHTRKEDNLVYSDSELQRDYYPTDLIRESSERVGEGGQSHVVAVMLKNKDKKVAVKYSSYVSKLKGHCDKELNFMKKLRHENIVEYYGVLYDSPPYDCDPLGFVMEYMEGGSLHGVIYKSHATFYNGYNVIKWIYQTAKGLDFLHSRNIIHRDIKPANLLLDRELKNLKICDLGISTQDPSSITECGTLYYTSPEVFGETRGRKFSTKCDIYSLGITLWEVCHRKPPYERTQLLNLILAIRERNVRPIIDDNVCPKEFADLIKIMWDGDIEVRPDAKKVCQTMEDIRRKYKNPN